MYASNDEEDWVYLHQTPPVKILTNISNEFIDAQNDDIQLSSTNNSHDLEQENHLLDKTTIKNSSQQLDTSTIMNENDVLNTGFELSKTSFLSNSEFIRSTPTISQQIKPSRKHFERYRNNSDTLITCTCLIVLFFVPFILGQIIGQWDQPTMNKIVNELVKTNQRLNEMKSISIGNFEDKLTKQLEDKLQNMINQQMIWYEHEKSIFISKIYGLQEILNKTQENFTNTINHLNNENQQLQEQIKLLEFRLEEQYPNEKKNFIKSSKLTFNKLIKNFFKQTVSIATHTSVNLSGLFEHLSASVSKIVDHRHKFIKENKQKLTDLTREKVQTTFHKAKLTYSSWIKSRKPKFPWQWSFSHNRQHMYYQGSTNEQICYTKFYFPINKICSMKNWMLKLFRL